MQAQKTENKDANKGAKKQSQQLLKEKWCYL
jgi:hypothetical protein